MIIVNRVAEKGQIKIKMQINEKMLMLALFGGAVKFD